MDENQATGGTPPPTDQSRPPGQTIPSNKDGDQLQTSGEKGKHGEGERIEIPKGKIDSREWDSERIKDIF